MEITLDNIQLGEFFPFRFRHEIYRKEKPPGYSYTHLDTKYVSFNLQLPPVIHNHISDRRAHKFPVPTEFVISKAGYYEPQYGYAIILHQLFYKDGKIVRNDRTVDGEHLVLVEVWSDWGDDGHTEMLLHGHRLVTFKQFQESLSQWEQKGFDRWGFNEFNYSMEPADVDAFDKSCEAKYKQYMLEQPSVQQLVAQELAQHLYKVEHASLDN